MAQYNDFLDEINSVVPGVARPIIRPLLRQVVGQFCEDSRIWFVDLLPMQATGESSVDVAEVAADELEYLEASLVDVMHVTLDGKPIANTDFERVARKGIKWLVNPPAAGELVLTVTLKPAPDCSELPDKLLTDWALAIAQGAAWRLMMQPNKDWSDMKLGQYYKDEFERAINEARFEVNNQRQSNQSAKPYSFW